MDGFKHILYLLGDDPGTADGLWRAVELARRFDATLTLGVASPPTRDGGAAEPAPHPEGGPPGIRLASLDSETVTDRPGTESGWSYDLVVKPAGGSPGFRDRLFGGADRELLATYPAPVWHLGPEAAAALGPVVAAVDVGEPALEPLNRRIVRLASFLAASRDSALHLVHAWTSYGEGYACIPTFTRSRSQLPTILEEVYRERRAKLAGLAEDVPGDTPARIAIHKGHPARVIPRMATRVRAGLLVTGASTRRGFSGLLTRSTGEAILDRTPCDVVTLGPGTTSALSLPGDAPVPETDFGRAPRTDERPAEEALEPRRSPQTIRHGP